MADSTSSALGGLAVAGGVVALGVGGVYLYTKIQEARVHGDLASASNALAAAGPDGAYFRRVVEGIRASGSAAAGATGAAQASQTNENAGRFSEEILRSAMDAMRRAQTADGLARNLSVVRPRDKESQWKIGEGCWLPSEGILNEWRTGPTNLVRGLDLGFALTHLPDVYPRPKLSGVIVCYPRRYGFIRARVALEGYGYPFPRPLRDYYQPRASHQGIRNQLDIFLSSTADNGGQVALWDPVAHAWHNGRNVQWAIDFGTGYPSMWGHDFVLLSVFLPLLLRGVKAKPVFQPWKPGTKPPTTLALRRWARRLRYRKQGLSSAEAKARAIADFPG